MNEIKNFPYENLEFHYTFSMVPYSQQYIIYIFLSNNQCIGIGSEGSDHYQVGYDFKPLSQYLLYCMNFTPIFQFSK